jgi:uncharacterized membrane protein
MADEPPALMSQAQYARYRKCSAPYITKLKSQGRLTPPAIRPDKLIDRVLADQQLARLADPARALQKLTEGRRDAEFDLPAVQDGGGVNEAAQKYQESRASVADLQRQKLEIELQKMRGELVAITDVALERETASRLLRDTLLRMTIEAADLLAHKPAAEIRTLLRGKIETVLVTFADQLASDEAEDAADEADDLVAA